MSKKKRKKEKTIKIQIIKRLRFLILLFAATFLVASSRAISENEIHENQVKGNEVLSSTTVKVISEINNEKKKTLSERKKIKKLLARHPYIKDVKVIKKTQNKILIKITERKEEFIINTDESTILIDKDGFVLQKWPREIKTIENEKLKAIEELKIKNISIGQSIRDENEIEFEIIKTLVKELGKTSLINSIDHINVSNLDNLKFTYENRIAIEIGNTGNISYKIKFLSEILNNNLTNQNGCLKFISGKYHFFPS